MKKRFLALTICFLLIGGYVFAADGDLIVNGNIGVGTTSPANRISVNGVIQSTTGGFMFPDGTVQSTAGGGGAGTTPTLRAYLGANQSLSAATWAIMNINTVEENIGGGFDTGTHVYTIPETGWYSIYVYATGNSGTYALNTKVLLNGNKIIMLSTERSLPGGWGMGTLTRYLAQGNTLTFQVQCASVSFTLSSGVDNTYVQVKKLTD
jgi:hypothetical protein